MARGDGRIFLRGRIWWLAWCFNGRERRESSGSDDVKVARRLLRVRLGQVAKGERPAIADPRRRVNEVLDLYAKDRQLANRWSAATRQSVAWLRPHFGAWRVTDVTLASLTTWCSTMRPKHAAASLRTRLATLKAAFETARRSGLIEHRADFPKLPGSQPRKGFFTPAQAAAHLAAFTDRDCADLQEFLHLTGWRLNEGRQLAWTEVDRAAGVLNLDPARSKNRKGRTVPLVGALAALLDRRFKVRRLGCPWVFHHRGRPLTEHRFRARFREALADAELGAKIPHDLRRSMSRDQIRAGVSRRVAMSNTGHADERTFDGYDITALQDQARALLATEAYRAANSDNPSDSERASG